MISKDLNLKALASVKTLVILALLSALSVVLERFVGINTPQFKLHFGYLPVALAGILYGIMPAILVATVADVLSNLNNFNILFVLLAVLEGAVYGIFLHRRLAERRQMLIQAILCQLVVSVIIHAGFNTLLLWTLYRYFDPIRFLINALTYPIKVFTIYKMLNYRGVFEQYA
ncbi:MAG: folate family ECF transporter S component [Clostridiales bacterium]|nr:folate family ECF transporter S component [Clostridiales bacterium]